MVLYNSIYLLAVLYSAVFSCDLNLIRTIEIKPL